LTVAVTGEPGSGAADSGSLGFFAAIGLPDGANDTRLTAGAAAGLDGGAGEESTAFATGARCRGVAGLF